MCKNYHEKSNQKAELFILACRLYGQGLNLFFKVEKILSTITILELGIVIKEEEVMREEEEIKSNLDINERPRTFTEKTTNS